MKKLNVCVGLDLSINSTGVVICPCTDEIDGQSSYNLIVPKLTKKQKQCDYINHVLYSKIEVSTGHNYSEVERIKTKNSHEIVAAIEKILFPKFAVKKVCIEGVAFGAKGDVVGLAGLNYGVRYMLDQHNCDYEIVSPMQLKKYAVGNGCAKKDVMVDAFQNITKMTNPLNIKIDDVADAYFLCQLALCHNCDIDL